MLTLIEALKNRAEYYGLTDRITQTDDTLDVYAMDTNRGLVIRTQGDNEDLSVQFYADPMSFVRHEDGTKTFLYRGNRLATEWEDVSSLEVIEVIFQSMLPVIPVQDLIKRHESIEGIWTGTGYWFLVDQVEVHEDHLHILSTMDNEMVIPLIEGLCIPIKYAVK